MTADLTVRLGGVELKNPILPASGTFGYGADHAEYFDLNVLGGIAVKGTTLHPRDGNPLPRIAECEGGLLNAVGLQNPGARRVAEVELPALRARYAGPILANVGGFSIDEYAECCAIVGGSPHVAILELNVSCPNVHGGGLSFGADPRLAAEATRAAKAACDQPVFVKLSPNVTDVVAVAAACAEAGADGFTLINTLLGMRIDLRSRKPLLANRTGGLSGPAILPVAVRIVYDVSRAIGLPVIGVGGVRSARDALELTLAGASAVQVGSENLRDPLACPRIIAELPIEMERLGIRSLREIVGAAHR